ncbi:MAG: hypothetical protein J6Y63_08325 [Bacteroidales bacterium]|nr:hypothetical protein [Bacteroidales bacterium]
MKRLLILLLAAACFIPLHAQPRTYQVSQTGWGRIEKASRSGIPGTGAVGEMNISRWKKVSGTLTVDFDKKEAILKQNHKKDKTFTMLSDSRPMETRDGWTYVEYMALDGTNSVCHFWLCKHEDGTERLLTLYPWFYPDTVYGYMLTPAE